MLDGFDMTRIAGSLRYGLLDESKRISLAAAIAIVVLVCGVAAGTTIVAINMTNGVLSVNEGIGGIIGLVFALILFGFLSIRYVIREANRKRAIISWLDDAVELKAFARMVRESERYNFDEPRKYMIRLSFKYNGDRYKFTSSVESCWRDYCDREVDVMYSPKFREVILLKPEKHKSDNV